MWYQIKLKLPYHQDKDYQETIINSIINKLGNVPIDITLLNDYGIIEVLTDKIEDLKEIQNIGEIKAESADRMILSGNRVII